ncbi:MAG: hypothetical protein LR015_09330 [Verrucomicrobia bacterium]|nr:hypothetical protein [Verrucomicrobiota bacterium]
MLLPRCLLGKVISVCATLLSACGLSWAEYVISAFNQERGGPANRINGVYSDQQGFVWLATFEGLIRFDGATHTRFNTANHPGLLGGVFALTQGHDGTIWALSSTSVLLRFDAAGIQSWQGPVTYAAERFGKLPTTPQGRPLLDDLHGFVTIDENDEWVRFLHYEWKAEIPDYYTVDPLGQLWVATRSGQLFLFGEEGKRVIDLGLSPGQPQVISALVALEDSAVVLSVNGQLAIMDCATLAIQWIDRDQLYIPQRRLRISAGSTRSEFWVASISGDVFRVREEQGQFSVKVIDLGVPGPHMVNSLHRVADGRVLIGTYDRGLLTLLPRTGVSYAPADGLGGALVNAVIDDGSGGLLIAHGRGLTQYTEGRFHSISNAVLPTGQYLLDVYRDRQGRLWTSSLSGLPIVREEDGSWRKFTEFAGLAVGGFRTFAEDNDGVLWVGAERGLVAYDNNGIRTYGVDDGMRSTFVLSLFADADNRLWFGTARGGLHVLVDGQISPIDIIDRAGRPLSQRTVFSITPDESGVLWVGVTGGLMRIRNDEVTFLDLAESLGYTTFFHVVSDHSGYFWLSTSRGLLRVPRDELVAAVETADPTRIRTLRLLTAADGLPGNAVRANSRTFRAANGFLWFGMENGLFGFQPAKIRERPTKVATYITSLEVNGEEIGGDWVHTHRSHSVAYGKNRIQIHFTSPVFIDAESTRFVAKLEGFDPDWRVLENRFIDYTNLRPGRYHFRVRLMEADPDNQELTASLALTVTPQFWQTPLFIVLFVALALVVIAGSFKFRLHFLYNRQKMLQRLVEQRTEEIQLQHAELQQTNQKLANLNQEKNEILSIVAHDLRNPLAAVESVANLLLADARKGRYSEVESLLSGQINSVEQMRELIQQLLDNKRIEQGLILATIKPVDATALFRQVARLFHHKLIQKSLRLDISGISLDSIYVAADPVLLRQVLENLLSNAIKFSLKVTPSGYALGA